MPCARTFLGRQLVDMSRGSLQRDGRDYPGRPDRIIYPIGACGLANVACAVRHHHPREGCRNRV